MVRQGTIAGVESAEVLGQLIRHACVNDGSGAAQEEANAELLLSLIAAPGVDVVRAEAAPGRPSFVARWPGRDRSAPALMLLGHTDVVPADPTRWDRDPYSGDLVDGWVWGRGALDMLGHMATMALAFRDLTAAGRHLPGDVVFVAVADEEALGTYGMDYLLRTQPDAMQADWILGESGGARMGNPPALGVLTAEKGAWRVELRITSAPGHSSLPRDLHSAVEIAALAVTRLAHVEGPVTLSPEYQETVRSGFLPEIIDAALNPELLPILIQKLPAPMARLLHALTRTTVSPTGITTPGSWNTLGSHAVVTLDVRSVPGATWEQVHDLIELSLGELNGHVDIALIERGSSTASPTGTELWDIVERASQSIVPGSRLVPTMAPGITDARFMREQGAIAYGVGLYSEKLSPLDMVTMLHGDNERVDVESIALMQSLWSNIFDIYDSRS